MADNHDNDHDSDLEDRTPHKNTDTPPKDTPQLNNENDSPNTGAMEVLQDRLKQLEEEVLHQREPEKDLQREIKRRRELEDKLLKLEADLKAKANRSSHEDNSFKDQDPFTKAIMKDKGPKGLQSSRHDSILWHIRFKPSS
ncbi:hypothetical protein AHAS_Ahas09G0126600 [Arachis hypogaea]